MARRPRAREQPHLPGLVVGEAPWWDCHNLFSPAYLRSHLATQAEFPTAEESRELHAALERRWRENYVALTKYRNEAFTRSQFLDYALQLLGWQWIPEERLPAGRTRKKPDYCLFDSEAAANAAAEGPGETIFRTAAAVLEAKKAQHPLDRKSDQETPGWFPSEQVQDYLRHAKDNRGRFFNWAVLANGNEWRLYCEQTEVNAYFAFHVAHAEEFCPLEEFRYFVALFRPAAFEQDEQRRCFLDSVREESLFHQAELETRLRRRIFNVLEELAEGYVSNPANGLTDLDLPAVYETSLIFLYRLLFILYAESLRLLPAHPYGPGANARYRRDFSLARLTDLLREPNRYATDTFPNLYDELKGLFHLVNGTRPEQNAELGVTEYNGGLFDPGRPANANIERWWVGERSLANVLRQLIFAQPPPRGRTRQQLIQTEETVAYGALEVRQLGDVYEGLLGGRLVRQSDGLLDLVNDRGENQREGIFYTPDWVVRYLVKETLQPLIDEIEAGTAVQKARDSGLKDGSFAEAVLCLRVLDPAMGSGHFLVRATEYLAEQIAYYPTTPLMTEQIVAQGSRRRSREEILADGKIPVPPGVPQEQAEIAYWRRRVVESCIYGVDTNEPAVELAKLSLWLTCLALEEPLNFLDHHLRPGNSLIGARVEELQQLPGALREEEREAVLDIGTPVSQVLAKAIQATLAIQEEASTVLAVVKRKETRWQEVREALAPFMEVADLWIAALDGLQVAEGERLNQLDYRNLALFRLQREPLSEPDQAHAEELWNRLAAALEERRSVIQPFHWELEFPAVFYNADGTPRPEGERGFDAVLGNPPYVSTGTSAEERWRPVVTRRAAFKADLYLHFTALGFSLLRPGGQFGFIVSDTFFTNTTKERMREWLQAQRLRVLGQCDPFPATVDAAIFVAQKGTMADGAPILFVQARYSTENSRPELELPELPAAEKIVLATDADDALARAGVEHGAQGCLRLHRVPASVYRRALQRTFFEPTAAVLRLYQIFNEPLEALVDEWWERIKGSDHYGSHRQEIEAHLAALNPGDVTLVGLVAEGGVGLQTSNNPRFLGYAEGTRQAQRILAKREEWTGTWLADSAIGPVFRRLLTENGGDPNRPTANGPAWEACIQPLRAQFDAGRQRSRLGFRNTDLYRIVSRALVATDADFQFAWERRKAELLRRWQEESRFNGFWQQPDLIGGREDRGKLRRAADVSDEAFCALCQEIQAWVASRRSGRRALREALGLRSSETYTDPADSPRIATIYNGLSGRGQWVPYRKGDPEGNRWSDNEPLFIHWSAEAVRHLSAASAPRWQGQEYFFREGISWTRGANHVPIKAKLMPAGVTDVNAMKLTPVKASPLDARVLLTILNANLFSFLLKKFVAHTWMAQLNDLRMMPLVVPSSAVGARLRALADSAIEAKQADLGGDQPAHALVAYTRQLAEALRAGAPAYLRPGAQESLLASAADCLAVIELAVNWELEKLYGVEGLGPFDEF